MTMPAADPLAALLRPERLTAIVDIGANPLDSDGEPPYRQMLVKRLCTVVGFEPQPDAHVRLDAMKSDLETYLPYAVGDGAVGVLKLCKARGMTSLLTPDPRNLSLFPRFAEYGEVIQEIALETRALDSITEITAIDLLKIDVQGLELTVFRNGSAKLSGAVAIQTEVSFVPLYHRQPVFGEIDLALRSLGFIPHMFANLNKRMILPVHDAARPFAAMNQLLEGDVVYVRDFSAPERMSAEQLKQLALVAHHCYASYDLAANCIHHLIERKLLPQGSIESYLAMITTGGAAGA
jgi:FkbM family methyltransferase